MKFQKAIQSICIIASVISISGCIPPRSSSYDSTVGTFQDPKYRSTNHRLADNMKIFTNIPPKALETISENCDGVTQESHDHCFTAHTAAHSISDVLGILNNAQSDIFSTGDVVTHSALRIGKGYVETWDLAIDNRTNFNNELKLFTNLVSLVDIAEKIKNTDQKVQILAKELGTKEAVDYAISVHSIVDLGLSPRGSLLDYQQQLQNVQTQYESAKTRLSLTIKEKETSVPEASKPQKKSVKNKGVEK